MSDQEPPESRARDEILLLGKDHGVYGGIAVEVSRDGGTACALSVGRDEQSPSLLAKASADVPNEDALLAVTEGSVVLLAVADAHWGHESSQELLTALARVARPLPASPDELRQVLASCGRPEAEGEYESETTLLVAVLNRASGVGFGVSFGDSSLMVVGAGGARRVSPESPCFVTPLQPVTLVPQRSLPFELEFRPGELVCAFTDGINECHYQFPETSVQPEHMEELLRATGPDPVDYARRLTELALAGVDGNPGGQDNIALIVTGR